VGEPEHFSMSFQKEWEEKLDLKNKSKGFRDIDLLNQMLTSINIEFENFTRLEWPISRNTFLVQEI